MTTILEMPSPARTCAAEGKRGPSAPAGIEDGGVPTAAAAHILPRPFAVLDLPTKVEFMRWCEVCQQIERFVAAWECTYGLVGCCLGCGDERVMLWSRTNSEVA